MRLLITGVLTLARISTKSPALKLPRFFERRDERRRLESDMVARILNEKSLSKPAFDDDLSVAIAINEESNKKTENQPSCGGFQVD